MAGMAAIQAAEDEAARKADPAGYAKRKSDDARWAAGLAAGRSPDEMLQEMYAEAEPLPDLKAMRAKAAADAAPVTMRQYARIVPGMTVGEVWAILDPDACEEFASSAAAISYTCKGTGGGVMSVMFVDGEVVSKSQNGLK